MIAVGRKGDQASAQAVRGFGVSESCLARCLKIDDSEYGLMVTSSSAASATGGGRPRA